MRTVALAALASLACALAPFETLSHGQHQRNETIRGGFKSDALDPSLLQADADSALFRASSEATGAYLPILASKLAVDALTASLDMVRHLIYGSYRRKRAVQSGQVQAVHEQISTILSQAQQMEREKICAPIQYVIVADAASRGAGSGAAELKLDNTQRQALVEVLQHVCPQTFLPSLPDWMNPEALERRYDQRGTSVLMHNEWKAAVLQSVEDGLRQAAREELFAGQVAGILASSAIPECSYDTKQLVAKPLQTTCMQHFVSDAAISTVASSRRSLVLFDYEGGRNQPVPLAEYAMRQGNTAPLRNIFRSGAMTANLPFARSSLSANWQSTWCGKLRSYHYFWTDSLKYKAFHGLLDDGKSLSTKNEKNVRNAKAGYTGTVQAMRDCLMFGQRSKVRPEDPQASNLIGTTTLNKLGIVPDAIKTSPFVQSLLNVPISVDALLFSAGVQVPAHDIFGQAYYTMRLTMEEAREKHAKCSKQSASKRAKDGCSGDFDPSSVDIPEPINDVLSLMQFAVGARADTFSRMEKPSDYFDPSENVVRLIGNAKAAVQGVRARKQSKQLEDSMHAWVKRQAAASLGRIAVTTTMNGASLGSMGNNFAAQLVEGHAGNSEAAKYSILAASSVFYAAHLTVLDQQGRARLRKLVEGGGGWGSVAFDLIANGALDFSIGTAMWEQIEDSASAGESELDQALGSAGQLDAAGDLTKAVPDFFQGISGLSSSDVPEADLLVHLERCGREIRYGHLPLVRVVLHDFAAVLSYADKSKSPLQAVPGGAPNEKDGACDSVVMALGQFVPSHDSKSKWKYLMSQPVRFAKAGMKKLWKTSLEAGMYLAQGPGLSIAQFSLAHTSDVLGNTVFPILGLIKSVGSLIKASYKLHRERMIYAGLNKAAPLQHTIQFNDALYAACHVIRDQRGSVIANAVAIQQKLKSLKGSALRIVISSVAEGLADVALELEAGDLASKMCMGYQPRPDDKQALPIFVRNAGSGVKQPTKVLQGIKLHSLAACMSTQQGPHSTHDFVPIQLCHSRPVYPSGGGIMRIALAYDCWGRNQYDMYVTQDSSGALVEESSFIGELELTYGATTATDTGDSASIIGIYGGIMTGRTESFMKKSSVSRMFTKDDNSRIAIKACAADQVAAGASRWAKHEYYGIGDEPDNDIDKFNWDFARVAEWAEEEELIQIADDHLISLSTSIGNSMRGKGDPFDGDTVGCSDQLDHKYHAKAFFFAESGEGAPITSVLLQNPGKKGQAIIRMGDLKATTVQDTQLRPAASIETTLDGLGRIAEQGKLSYSVRLVVPAPAIADEYRAYEGICLPKLSREGKISSAPYDGCKLREHSSKQFPRYEELNLIVTKNFVLRGEASKIGVTARAAEATKNMDRGYESLTRHSCIDPTQGDDAGMCSRVGRCVLSMDLSKAVQDHQYSTTGSQAVQQAGTHRRIHHMSWACDCPKERSGRYCEVGPKYVFGSDSAPVALVGGSTEKNRALQQRITSMLDSAPDGKHWQFASSELVQCWNTLSRGTQTASSRVLLQAEANNKNTRLRHGRRKGSRQQHLAATSGYMPEGFFEWQQQQQQQQEYRQKTYKELFDQQREQHKQHFGNTGVSEEFKQWQQQQQEYRQKTYKELFDQQRQQHKQHFGDTGAEEFQQWRQQTQKELFDQQRKQHYQHFGDTGEEEFQQWRQQEQMVALVACVLEAKVRKQLSGSQPYGNQDALWQQSSLKQNYQVLFDLAERK